MHSAINQLSQSIHINHLNHRIHSAINQLNRIIQSAINQLNHSIQSAINQLNNSIHTAINQLNHSIHSTINQLNNCIHSVPVINSLLNSLVRLSDLIIIIVKNLFKKLSVQSKILFRLTANAKAISSLQKGCTNTGDI
jgi:cell fate (sporulation/competence/biofilm development) regulator YmcA (YheA/YmcA/DUF963 family)